MRDNDKMEIAMDKRIRVAIIDDHQSVIDGYTVRLASNKNIQVVGTANYGSQLDELVAGGNVDVLLMDVSLPNSPDDDNPFPLLSVLPQLRKDHPQMAILIISMHKERPLIRAVLDAGANGYILKDDRDANMQLAEAVTLVNTGGIYISKQLSGLFTESNPLNAFRELSKRQLEALSITAAYPEISTEELAKKMSVAPSTVRNLLSKAYSRLHVPNRTAAIARARQLGLITPYPPDSKQIK
jgi:two-component system nitrate/nitrite response regulator NarL